MDISNLKIFEISNNQEFEKLALDYLIIKLTIINFIKNIATYLMLKLIESK